MNGQTLTLYCDHVSKNHVHCNRVTKVTVDNIDRTVREIIEAKTGWEVRRGEMFCDEHAEK